MATPAPVIVNNGNTKRGTLILIVVVLALAIAIGLYFYFQGKKKGSNQTNVDISSPLNQDGSVPAASEQEIKQLAEDLYDDMKGANFVHTLTPWNKLNALSDSDFIKVNNNFNANYQAESEQSFKEWVENESTSPWLSSGNILFKSAKDTTLARMKKLNIK